MLKIAVLPAHWPSDWSVVHAQATGPAAQTDNMNKPAMTNTIPKR
jgi:hypothetical protein